MDEKPQTKNRKPIWLTLAAIVLICAGVGYAMYAYRMSPNTAAQRVLADESSAKTSVYRRSWFGGEDIVFDVEEAEGEMSAVAMTRRLLKVAEALKGEDFGRVYLASRGREKFFLEGSYFKRIGEERGWQNPVYTIRTMPENVQNADGSPAFGTRSGGLIGLIGGQMEDNNEFHRKWWMDDAISTLNR